MGSATAERETLYATSSDVKNLQVGRGKEPTFSVGIPMIRMMTIASKVLIFDSYRIGVVIRRAEVERVAAQAEGLNYYKTSLPW